MTSTKRGTGIVTRPTAWHRVTVGDVRGDGPESLTAQRARTYVLYVAASGFPAAAVGMARRYGVTFNPKTVRKMARQTGPVASFAALLDTDGAWA